jgi:tetratricopeptide (TPR) repeat protein
MTYSGFGTCCLFKGLFSEAETYLLEAINLHRKTKQVAWGPWAYFHLGELYFYSGDFEKAQYFYNQANLYIEHRKVLPSWFILSMLKSIRAKVMQNNKDIHLESIFELAKQNKLKFYEGVIPNHIGGILMNIDVQFFPTAEEWINKAIETDKQNGLKWHLADDYALYAELFKRKRDSSKAKENLSKAIEIFKECGADGWVEKYKKELVTL